jgi:hypothetical protein
LEYESIFSKGTSWHTNACLNFQSDMSHGYIYGYKKAADILSKRISTDHSEVDYLVYPIIFLYRHHIELLLKNLLKLNIQLHNSEETVPTNHNIKDLWPRVKGYYRKINKRKNESKINYINNIINELCQIDPESMSFRYNEDKKGNLPNESLRSIDIKVFSQVIGKVSDTLETFEYQLNAEIESKWNTEF